MNKEPHKPDQGSAETPGKEALCKTGLFCAETVLSVIAHEQNVRSSLIPRIATGLCSGMARTCGTCGALTGGILALSAVHGRSTPEESVEHSYALVAELVERFEKENKATNCAELLGCDLATEKGQQKFETQNLFEQCKGYTRITIAIVRDLLARNSPSTDHNPGIDGVLHE